MADDLDNDEEDVPAHALPVFNRIRIGIRRRGQLRQGSHVLRGILQEREGPGAEQARIFSSSGMSHGVSRSIGDLGAARGCVATPEISTHRILAGGSARIVVCSDGVWDVFDSLGDEGDPGRAAPWTTRLGSCARWRGGSGSSAASRWTTSRQSSSTSASTRRAPATPPRALASCSEASDVRRRVNINRKVLFSRLARFVSPSSRFARV